MEINELWLYILLGASVAFLVVPMLIVLARRAVRSLRNTPYRRSGISRVLILSAYLLCSTWCLRLAVGLFAPVEGEETLSIFERICAAFLHSLQTFSMDEDYAAYIEQGKAMFPDKVPFLSRECWETCYGVYASVLNVIAPVAGGTFVFEILSGVFPRIKLMLVRLDPFREKLFFSKLNEASAALATSICDTRIRNGKNTLPVLIFTDTYVDRDSEKHNELLQAVRRVNAICVRDDLAHVNKCCLGKRTYYLVSEQEQENLKTFANMTEGVGNIRSLKRAQIYLFVETDAYVRLEKQARSKLERSPVFKRKRAQEHMPQINPVRPYRNLVHNLLGDVPLYEPLVGKPNAKTLTVTIFGNGIIGTEAFLNVYWMGQLPNHELCIQVVSQDDRDTFWKKIDYINPEIRRTVREPADCQQHLPQAAEKWDSILYCNEEDRNPPYCTVRYVQADVKAGNLWQEQTEQFEHLLQTDYFIVALGADADNMAIAEKLRCAVGARQLERQRCSNTVIAYAVFDSALCDTLNEKQHHQSVHATKTDIYMRAFGSLRQVYSCENLMMTRHQYWAEEIDNGYRRVQTAMYRQELRRRGHDAEADYNYWSNIARAMHIKYKVFSMGWIQTSLFDCVETKHELVHRKLVARQCDLYRRIAIDKDYQQASKERAQMQQHKQLLAWVEHRRWNAYTRTMGYRCTDAIAANFALYGTHKNMRMKLHPCLVESAKPGTEAANKPDRLDAVSNKCQEWKHQRVDFKQYDTYNGEYDAYDTLDAATRVLKCHRALLLWLCNQGKIRGAVHFQNPEQWLIPKETVAQLLRIWYSTDRSMAQRINVDVHTVIAFCEHQESRRIWREKRWKQYGQTIYIPWYLAWPMQIVMKRRFKMYQPKPMDLSKINLNADIWELTEQIAENVHDNWAIGRIAEGWTYGPVRDDKKKTTPCLVPYAQLPEAEKEYDRKTAVETLKMILALGYRIEKLQPSDGE